MLKLDYDDLVTEIKYTQKIFREWAGEIGEQNRIFTDMSVDKIKDFQKFLN
jgi:hypothetical protein